MMVENGKTMGQNHYTMEEDAKTMDRITIQWQGMLKGWTKSLYNDMGW